METTLLMVVSPIAGRGREEGMRLDTRVATPPAWLTRACYVITATRFVDVRHTSGILNGI